jgi:hypothetical protein
MSLTQEAFVRFLQTGAICGVAVGAASGTVMERLGGPLETTRLRRGLTLLAYDGRLVQVTLDRGRVVLIGIYLRYARAISPGSLTGGVPIPVDRLTLISRLEEWRVPFRESLRAPEVLEVGDGGVLAVFGEDGVLQSFQVALRA